MKKTTLFLFLSISIALLVNVHKANAQCNHVVVGYWHSFDNGLTPLIPLRDVPCSYNVVDVAFLASASPTDPTLSFPLDSVDIESTAQFKLDVATLQNKGIKVLASIGGANGSITLSNTTDENKFLNSLIFIINEYGFNGVDLDIENGITLNSGDNDYKNPTTPTIVYLIDAMKKLKTQFGNGFYITMAPQTANVQGGISAYAGVYGSYLPIIYGLGSDLNFVHVQYYNTGSCTATDGNNYSEATPDFIVAMTDMLLTGFTMANGQSFTALSQNQVAFGMPATSGAASGGYMANSGITQALNYLTLGTSFGGQYVLHSKYPNLEGIMTWSVNWDSSANYAFADAFSQYFCGSTNFCTAVTGTAPVAAFKGVPTSVCAGDAVVFTDTSSNSPTVWKWTFENGTPSTATTKTVSVVYTTPGVDSVKLVVSNSTGKDSLTKKLYITVNANPTVTASVTDNVVCKGSSTGVVSASPSGGAIPYTYLWTGGGTNATESNLSAGTYTVTIKDKNGCSATASVIITQPATSVSGSASVSATITCNGDANGSAAASASGGTAPYTYSWSGGGTNATKTGLSAGTYTVEVTDHNGCNTSTTVSITQPATLSANATVTSDANCGGDNGSASSTVSGGTSPYTYLWSSGAGTNATATGLSAGTYTLSVSDKNGCTHSATITITQTTTLSGVSAKMNANVKCNGSSDGSATASTTAGTSPYTYSWTGGQTNATATGLSAGTYTVTITDKNGCSGIASVIITQPSILSVSGNVTSSANCGGSTGSASSMVSGGTSPYTYSWTGGGTNSSISGLSAGTYTLNVTDNNGCNTSAAIVITQSSALNELAANATNITCNGMNDGSLTVTVTGGTAPYTYLWTGGITTSAISGLSVGTYTVEVTDHNGCSGTASASITQPSVLSSTTYSVISTTVAACNGVAAVTISGGTVPYSYSWSQGGATTDTIKNKCAGDYCCIITDNNGCTESTCVTITAGSTGIENINTSTDISIYPDPSAGYFTIAGVMQGQVIELYNILGQKLNSIAADKPTMYYNISNQPDGIYLIRIVNKDGSLVLRKKVVKVQ